MVISNNGISQFEEQKDHVAVEQILQVVFLDPGHSNPVSSKRRETQYQVRSVLCFLHQSSYRFGFFSFILFRHWRNSSDNWLRLRLQLRCATSLLKKQTPKSLVKGSSSMNG